MAPACPVFDPCSDTTNASNFRSSLGGRCKNSAPTTGFSPDIVSASSTTLTSGGLHLNIRCHCSIGPPRPAAEASCRFRTWVVAPAADCWVGHAGKTASHPTTRRIAAITDSDLQPTISRAAFRTSSGTRGCPFGSTPRIGLPFSCAASISDWIQGLKDPYIPARTSMQSAWRILDSTSRRTERYERRNAGFGRTGAPTVMLKSSHRNRRTALFSSETRPSYSSL